MKNFVLAAIFIIFTIVAFFPFTALATDLRPAVLANACAGCHGTDGKSTGSIPSIHGLQADYFNKAMKDFRSGARQNSVMGRIAKGYTDEEINLMAGHFAGLK